MTVSAAVVRPLPDVNCSLIRTWPTPAMSTRVFAATFVCATPPMVRFVNSVPEAELVATVPSVLLVETECTEVAAINPLRRLTLLTVDSANATALTPAELSVAESVMTPVEMRGSPENEATVAVSPGGRAAGATFAIVTTPEAMASIPNAFPRTVQLAGAARGVAGKNRFVSRMLRAASGAQRGRLQ